MRELRGMVMVLLICGLGLPLQAVAEQALEAGMVNPGYHEQPEWFKTSFLDIREDVSEAAGDGKRVLLYFYQDGCPYCSKMIRDNFGQRSIATKARNSFEVIAINMWGDREVTSIQGTTMTEKDFAASLRVMFTPTMLFLDESGKPVLRVNGYYAPDKFESALDYVGQHMEAKLSFRDYYQQQAPAVVSGKLHAQPFFLKPPYDLVGLQASSSKPLLVLFEQKQCRACDELHTDVFKRKQTREQLARFNVVRFDMWGKTPLVSLTGEKLTEEKWAQQLKVQYAPTMILFDSQGKEVIRADAYLKSFHLQSVMDYVASGAYRKQPNFQRYISTRADKLEAQGVHVELMK